ncbi:MAG TPA: ABC transporter substrate-binding protein [Actinomycetes bacterium]|nr:ABC transporter substrate-binding protein [Actinomycetes bacterium]
MQRARPFLRPLALVFVLALVASACGGDDSGSGDKAGARGGPIVVGTTDTPTSYDPAGAYDLPSWTVIYNTYQNLLQIPAGGNKPVPDAAESCEFSDPKTYTCKLKQGLKFSNGSDLTSEDVVFSFNRVNKIADPNGPSSLLGSMTKVEAVDPATVRFTLKEADATWPYVLTTGGAAIVPSDVYPADKLQPSDKIIGSGPYKLVSFKPKEQAVVEPNPNYTGPNKPANSRTILQFFDRSSALKLAVEQGEVDVAYRSLTPTDIEALRGETGRGVNVVEGEGAEIRYLVFNVRLDPSKNLAVRKAMAQAIDRQAIADNVYNGTVKPLYSMVAEGLEGHTDAFKDAYGDKPDAAAAKKTLSDAGVATPVATDVWYTPSHYGDSSADEYTEIKRSLESTGLFKINLKSTEWQQYQKAYADNQYAMFQLGWFPDYPDADNYAAPFFAENNFYNNGYKNPKVDQLIAQERAEQDPAARSQIFAQIQQIAAQEIPTIPVWQGKQIAAVREGVTGVEKTFDPSFTFRFWLISKGQ